MSRKNEPRGGIAAYNEPSREALMITRRNMFKVMLGLAGVAATLANANEAFGAEATQETLDKLSDAQAQYDAVQAQIDSIAAEYTKLSEKQDKLLSEIEDVQTQIEDQQKKLEKKQAALSSRVSGSYKDGGSSVLTLLLSSSSFEELLNNTYYIDKINASDRADIEDIHTIKTQLDEKKSSLEELKAQQEEQMKEMQSKQAEAQSVLSNLSDEVKQLMEQRDAEILQSAQEEEAQRKAAEAAAAAARSASSGSGGHSGGSGTGTTPSGDAATGSAARVVASCRSTPSPGSGLCAAWVSNVFTNAGFGFIGGNACDMYNAYCTSSDKSSIKPGMIVAVSSHAGTSAGRIYGHIGIYIGNGTMMDNIGYIRTISLDGWISSYNSIVTPRWGWLGGIVLS